MNESSSGVGRGADEQTQNGLSSIYLVQLVCRPVEVVVYVISGTHAKIPHLIIFHASIVTRELSI